jgi:hypothetical protein
MKFRGEFPAALACIGIAIVAFPWGLLALAHAQAVATKHEAPAATPRLR